MTSLTSRTPALGSPAPEAGLTKPLEIEELIDLHVHRPAARRLVGLFLPTPITPNQVTIFAGALGVSAGICLLFGATRPPLRLLAAGLLFSSVVLDCVDGQLARARRTSSTTGAILDGVADYFVGFFTLLGATYAAVVDRQNQSVWWLGLFAVISMAAQCALFDHVKTRYVSRAGFAPGREEDLARVNDQRARARASGAWGDLLLLWLYEHYARAQRAALGGAKPLDPARFRRENRFKMRAWTALGVGTHLAMFYLAAAISYVWPGVLYATLLFIVTAMNAGLAVLIWLEGRR
jgi:hypothetical protein